MPLENKEINKIERIIELVYLSEYVKHTDDKPLSLMLIAPPEQSKSHFLLKYETPVSKVVTDLSFMGLIKLLQGKMDEKRAKKGQKSAKNGQKSGIKQLIIPEFLKISQKKKSTFDNLMGLLNSYLENEGINEISLGNNDKIDLEGVNGAIITATTQHSYYQNIKKWEDTGFVSRFLYVSYSYSDKTNNEVIDYILETEIDEKKKKEPPILIKKNKKVFVKGIKEYNSELKVLAGYSIRQAKKLALLLKTIAISYDRDYIIKSDMEELKELNKFFNTKFTKI